MERRVLVAIFLSFLVLYSYQAFFAPPPPKPRAAANSTSPGAGPSSPAAAIGTPAAAPAPTVSATPPPGVTAVLGDTEERDIRVETAHVIAVFTNRGGRLKSWRLKDYRDGRGQPLELVANDLPGQPLPFSLRVPDEAVTGSLNGALYAVRDSPASDTVQTQPTDLVFEYRDNTGLHATKEFRLDPATYTVAFRADVSAGDTPLKPAIVWGPGLGDGDAQAGRYAVKPGALFSPATIPRRPSRRISALRAS